MRTRWSLASPEVHLHPLLQLFGDLLLLPLVDVGHKHPGVEGAVSGMDAQIFHLVLSVVQETHVGGLWDKLRGEAAI